MKKTLTAFVAFGGLALVGCDSPGEVELAQREYNSKVTIRLVQEVKIARTDSYRLEVRDSAGTMLGYLRTYEPNGGQVSLSPERVYDLEVKGVRLSGSK